IGPATAKSLVAARRRSVIRWSGDLRTAGVDVARAGWVLPPGGGGRGAGARAAPPAAAPLRAGRAPHPGAVPNPGTALRLSLMVGTRTARQYHAVGGAHTRLRLTIVFSATLLVAGGCAMQGQDTSVQSQTRGDHSGHLGDARPVLYDSLGSYTYKI